MKPLLLVSILSLLSTSVWAQEPPAIELTGVRYLETGAKMYRKVGQAGYEIGDVVRLKDDKNINITRKARILRVGNKSVVFEVLAGTD